MKTVTSTNISYFNFPTSRAFWLPLLGTIVEYYDYALYGFTAALISQFYFPAADPTVSLLKTYIVFALGAFAKPIGSLIFGWVGDRFGRKIALRWTMLGIFIPTTLMGILPTYQDWGVTATVILIFCRLFQGIFLSGEFDGTRIMLYESFLKDRPTLINCMVGMTAYLGIFLASYAVSLTSQLTMAGAWRIPFLIGGILGGGIFILRHFLQESVDYLHYQKQSLDQKKDVRINKKAFVGTILLCGGVGGLYQLFFVYISSFFSNSLGLFSLYEMQNFIPFMIFIHIIGQIGAAWMSDHWCPKKVIILGLGITVPFIFILGLQLFQGKVSLALLILIAISLSFVFTPGFTLIIASVGVGARYRFVSLGHSLGSVLFSGCAPAISLFLWQWTGFDFVIAIHALALCLCVGVSMRLLTAQPRHEVTA